MNNVKIENRAQFFASFHENVPFQSDEGAEDQPQWMAMHAYEYHDARIQMGAAPGELSADHFPKQFWFNITVGEDGTLTMTYTNVTDKQDK